MERAMFVSFVLVVVALIAVRAEQCDDSNVLARYVACKIDLQIVLGTKGSSASVCNSLLYKRYRKVSKKMTDCYNNLRGKCGQSSLVKWSEHVTTASVLRKSVIYTCSHMKEMRSLFNCSGPNPTRFTKCVTKAIQSSTDLCGQWNAILPCNRRFFVKCSKEQLKVALKNLEFQRPDGCKIKKTPTVTMTPSPKKGR